MRTTLNLDTPLVQAAKQRAAAEGRSLTSLVEEGLRLALRRRSKPSPGSHVALPTDGGDGPAPGVDLGDYDLLKTLVEDDLDATVRSRSVSR